MGGFPVLGGLMASESELLQLRQKLSSTSSPAAREMAHLRATSLDSRLAPAAPSQQIAPWLVRTQHFIVLILRIRWSPTESG